ncbi:MULTISPECIES: ATPase [Acidianus]|uniref:ATP synthase subunit epsilon n=1 Tax=Candidatus Acidianus copahuensis TaxID=1160895 RepID=A0A031LPS1_9CREN|nr:MULTISPECIES: ATPase [Acidianus]EZQ07001.1 ATP synthase subunit epsilon [Candidatus Acidianus copahuensis]NON61159.1 ATPase [Acidianus sp. RZ1]
MSEYEKFVKLLKSVLDDRLKDGKKRLNDEFNTILKNKEKDLEDIKRKALKEIINK